MLRKFRININNKEYLVEMEELGASETITAPVIQQPVQVAVPESVVHTESKVASPKPVQMTNSIEKISGEGTTIEAPMPGNILNIEVNLGDKVRVDQCLLILEAMKMQNEIVAPKEGIVSAIHVTNGDFVDAGKPLITIS